MRSTLSGLVAVISLASSVSAHGFVTDVLIDGQSFPGFNPYNGKYADGITQPWASQQGENADGPAIFRFQNSLLCQMGAKAAPKTASVSAGSKITFHWNQWPPTHKGPILTYLAECGGDCSQVDDLQLKWFKIEEAGLLDPAKNLWATDLMMQQGDAWNIQIPMNIKSGNYVMRHEMISLESTNSDDGVQFYPTCFNLQVSGGTAQSNPQGVSLMQAYQRGGQGLNVGTKRGDPAVYSYTPPGPQINPSIGAIASNQINTGASSNGRTHIYPNANKDPYTTSGQQPNYNSSPSTPTYETPNNTPQQQPQQSPQTQTGSMAGDANRKHCDDGYVQCRQEQGRRKFKRGTIAARTPQDQSYRTEYCYQKWEVCLNAALYGAKSQPTNNGGYQQNNNNGGYQQNNNGYQQSNNNGYYQQNNSGYQQKTNTGYQQKTNTGYQQKTNTGYQQKNTNSGYQQKTNNNGYQQKTNTGYQQKTNTGSQQKTNNNGYKQATKSNNNNNGYYQSNNGGYNSYY
ncbi:hypothetical protein TWF718_010861 [Orbilia javanica]|uniref:lytic cellulose monooxygenase (C4-dehydrogenating) n=1 Tax=Orbilia javanica TaxID=47235 RepID=A0AAN8MN21_9PEZI